MVVCTLNVRDVCFCRRAMDRGGSGFTILTEDALEDPCVSSFLLPCLFSLSLGMLTHFLAPQQAALIAPQVDQGPDHLADRPRCPGLPYWRLGGHSLRCVPFLFVWWFLPLCSLLDA